MNLALCLLVARRFVPKEQIRRVVEGYAGQSDAAFERMFERDKDELRAMGVPVETGSNGALWDDDVGYRIRRTTFDFPPIEFTPDEATVLGAAARVWQQASVAESTTAALIKLRAAGVETDTDRLTALAPTITAREPSFDPLWQASLSRTRVSFRYRGGTEDRVVEPWRVTLRKGSWYLLGFDAGRGEPRRFKLSRINGDPALIGEPDAYQVPPDVDLDALARSLEPDQPDAEALIAVRGDRAPAMRRRGTPVSDAEERAPEGYTAYRVPYARRSDLVAELASVGADALVLRPPSLADEVIAHLRGVLASAGELPGLPDDGSIPATPRSADRISESCATVATTGRDG